MDMFFDNDVTFAFEPEAEQLVFAPAEETTPVIAAPMFGMGLTLSFATEVPQDNVEDVAEFLEASDALDERLDSLPELLFDAAGAAARAMSYTHDIYQRVALHQTYLSLMSAGVELQMANNVRDAEEDIAQQTPGLGGDTIAFLSNEPTDADLRIADDRIDAANRAIQTIGGAISSLAAAEARAPFSQALLTPHEYFLQNALSDLMGLRTETIVTRADALV